MTALARTTPESTLAEGASVLRRWADEMIEHVGFMGDDEVIETARLATALEGAAFRVRGACAAEMKTRIRERLRRNGVLHHSEDLKVGKQLRALAADIGVSARTLDDDARIFEHFGESLRVDTETPREVFRLALAAREPEAAVEMYTTRKDADPRYSTLDYRRDVSELNRGRTTPYAPAPATHRISFDLPGKAIAALKLICERLQCDDEEAVTRALVHSARALEDGNDI